ncbi:MAG: enoyl-CoA hydratase/isomerase family protein [Candidatus Tectomicrobia bacterium]|nr:enoyl-CoA hydratase/isomerase family protein [Candidatus Tectomicrobia bacterium]
MGKFDPRPAEDFNFDEILYTKKDWVATITINREKVYNALNGQCILEMVQALQDASWDDGVAVVVMTGAGEKAFCTGGDVKEYTTDLLSKPREYYKWFYAFNQVHDLLRNLGKPSIARLNGMVVGGGNEINLSCDLAIAAEHAKIRQVGTSVGSVAAAGATQLLPIIVGDRRARQILWLNEWVDAKTALAWGLVNEVVPMAELDKAVATMCEKLIDKFPECTRYTRQQTNFWRDLGWNLTVGHARDWLTLHYASIEPYEGMTSFVEKRPTQYRMVRERARDGKSSEFLWGHYKHLCPQCGAKGLPADFAFCGVCGVKLGG